jgi:hypothetical protein
LLGCATGWCAVCDLHPPAHTHMSSPPLCAHARPHAGMCAGALLSDASCNITVNGVTGGLDLCTAEGVAGGRADLPDVTLGRGACVCVCVWLVRRLLWGLACRPHPLLLPCVCVCVLCPPACLQRPPQPTTGLPQGTCTSDADCAGSEECNVKNVTRVCRCTQGLDVCQTAGRCQLRPPRLVELSP